MKKKCILILIFLLNGCSVANKVSTNEPKNEQNRDVSSSKYFVIVPHHNLVNREIDNFYKNLKEKYKKIDNVVIISPNHFNQDEKLVLSDNKNYCFGTLNLSCLKGKKVNLSMSGAYYSKSFVNNKDYTLINEHGIGNHFQFINKYFSKPDLFFIMMNINKGKIKYNDQLVKDINAHFSSGITLFISSVDFSHHVNEKVGVFHDLKTLDYLDKGDETSIEVDCPNCIYFIKDLATSNNNNFFNLNNRTSTDIELKIKSNYNNTTHIYGSFDNKKDTDNKVFSGTYNYSKFDNPLLSTENNSEIFGMFFGDTHFTRGFTTNNKLEIEDYLNCFYHNKDKIKKPMYWHNRMFYSFDFVGVNLETSVGNINECNESKKSIIFRTEPFYFDYFKEIGINLYSISNNHTYDCGEMGYQSTKKHLQDKELYYYGDGRNNEENTYKTIIRGTKVAFLGFDDVSSNIDKNFKAEKISQLHSSGYIVIVNMHWGMEYDGKSNERQRGIARLFIDKGANLIIGHHPHVVQEYEIYKGVPIFYSLGNFIFDQPFSDTLKGYGVVFSMNGNGIKYNVLEFKRDSKTFMIDCNSFN